MLDSIGVLLDDTSDEYTKYSCIYIFEKEVPIPLANRDTKFPAVVPIFSPELTI